MTELCAPFPWFGGKRRVAHIVWERFGADVPNLVEPFFGSGAILLGRPGGAGPIETVNDADGLLCNAWRGIRQDPRAMAQYARDLAHECDLHARHAVLAEQRERLTHCLEGDPEYCDIKLAGWWLWGISLWIGGGWCSGVGPWRRVETDQCWQLLDMGDAGQGVQRTRFHLGNAGQWVNRRRLHLGNAGRGVKRQSLHLGDAGRGVKRQSLHLGDRDGLLDYMEALSSRLQRVRICCGDWTRVCGPTPTIKLGIAAVFLDPPYSDEAGRDAQIYAADNRHVAHDVRRWCMEWGNHPQMRIALCGYEGEGHEALELAGWECVAWKAHGGYGAGKGHQGDRNKHRERIWFSQGCLKPTQQRIEFGE